MHTCLLPLLSCPECQAALRLAPAIASIEVESGELQCETCGRTYAVEGGIPILAPRETLDAYADRWPDGLAHEWLVGKIEDGRKRYASRGPYAIWVGAAVNIGGRVNRCECFVGRGFARLL